MLKIVGAPTFPAMYLLLFHALLSLTAYCYKFSESITATGLLGSHFGVPGLPARYDYVVVGGGTAGLTLARRLVSNPSISVAVIEAGDFYEFVNGNFSEIPAYAAQFTGTQPKIRNPYLDWYIYTEPQSQLGGGSFLYDQGKVLGGSSARNFMWYVRATEGSFRKWADLVGDDSWTWSNVLHFYQKSVRYHPPDNAARPHNSSVAFNASAFSQDGGPLNVAFSSWVNPISAWLSKSFEYLGINEIAGFASGRLLGWAYIPAAIDPATQTRDSSETSFLREALRNTTNLYVYKNTLAKRILFDSNKTASGVQVQNGDVTYAIEAAKEVIVSAGVFRSPQLLMVSGIGPSNILSRYNIPLISDRPGVGQNMEDNVLVGPSVGVKVVTHSALADPTYLAEARHEYNVNRTGILTNLGGDVAAFVKLPRSTLSEETYQDLMDTFPADWPHLETLVLDAYFGAGRGGEAPPADSGVNATNFVGSSVGLITTFSRGNVTIKSNDTADNPRISPNWLLDPRDQELAVAAFKLGRRIFSNPAIWPVVAGEVFPGAKVRTDAEILAYCKQTVNPVYHASCTCKMGRANDTMAVLDSHARVYGVRGLRVVDASSFPLLLPGHPSANIYMLAEKIAHEIMTGG